MPGRDAAGAPPAEGAAIIAGAFQSYRDRFRTLTRRARRRFEERDWAVAQQDSGERLDLYGEVVDEGMVRLVGVLGSRLEDRPTWTTVRTVTGGNGGEDDNTGLNASTRYVRIYGTARGTQWGYSLFTFQVYGT